MIIEYKDISIRLPDEVDEQLNKLKGSYEGQIFDHLTAEESYHYFQYLQVYTVFYIHCLDNIFPDIIADTANKYYGGDKEIMMVAYNKIMNKIKENNNT